MEKKVCLKCGSEENVDPTEYVNCSIRDIMEKNDWCYCCSFWQNLYNENKDNPRWIRGGSAHILWKGIPGTAPPAAHRCLHLNCAD